MPRAACIIIVTAVTWLAACSDEGATTVTPAAAIPAAVTDLNSPLLDLTPPIVDAAIAPALDGGSAPNLADLGMAAAPMDLASAETVTARDAGSGCPPMPVLFSASGIQPLASDGQSLYGFDAHSIVRLDAHGVSTPVVSGIDTSVNWGLLVDDRYVFWSAALAGSHTVILRAPKTGGDATVLADVSPAGWTPLATADDFLYFTNEKNVFSLSKNGGAPQLIATSTLYTVRVAAVDALHVYWTSTDDTLATIERAPKAGGPPEIVASWSSNAISPAIRLIVADDTHLYAADYGMIRRIAKSDGQLDNLYDIQNPANPTFGDRMASLALGPDAVYWSSWPNDAPDLVDSHFWLGRVGKDGSGVRALVDADQFYSGMGCGGDSVYFSNGPYRICR